MRNFILGVALALVASPAFCDPAPAAEAVFDEAGVAGVSLVALGRAGFGEAHDAYLVTLDGEALPWSVDMNSLIFPVPRAGVVRISSVGGKASEVRAADLGAQDGPRTRAPRSIERIEKNLVFDRLETPRLELVDSTSGPWYWMEVTDGAKVEIPWGDWRQKVKVSVRLQPMRTPGVKHAIEIWWNGKKSADANWDGGAPFTAGFEVAADNGRGVRTLEFRTKDGRVQRMMASGPLGDGPPAYLDWISIEGPRIAGSNQASWVGEKSTGVELRDLKGVKLDVVFAMSRMARVTGCGGSVAVDGPVFAASSDALIHAVRIVRPVVAPDPDNGVEWLVVAPNAFREALAPLVERRQSQGLSAAFRSVEEARGAMGGDLSTSEAIRRFIRHAAKDWPEPKLKFVLLVGDATRGGEDGIPAGERDALGAGWVATDGFYARTDDEDDLPDLCVGRWPARTAEDAAALLPKVKRFEDAPPGEWRRRLHLALGTAGFGDGMDNLLKTGGMKIAGDLVPDAFSFHVQSTIELGLPFTYPHREYNSFLTQCVNEGCLVFAYSGHGWEHGLQSLKWAGKRYPIMDVELAKNLDAKVGLPMAFIFACLTGSFDETEDCLCEALVRAPGGPVAAIGSSGISHPYADMIFAKELMTIMFVKRAPTIGQGVLVAKRRVLKPAEGDAMRGFIDGMAAGSVGGPAAQARYRLDGSLAYNLFGDPATRIPWPGKAALDAPKSAAPGDAITISGSAELADGTAIVTLEPVRLKSLEPAEKVDLEADGAEDAMKRNWKKMNDAVAVRVEVAMKGGAFKAELTVPKNVPEGDYLVKVYAGDGKADAIGSRRIKIERN